MRKNILFSIVVLFCITAFGQTSKSLTDVLQGVHGNVSLEPGFVSYISPYLKKVDTTNVEDVEIVCTQTVIPANTKIGIIVDQYKAEALQLNDLGVIYKNYENGSFDKLKVRTDIPNIMLAVDGNKLYVIGLVYINEKWMINAYPATRTGQYKNEVNLIH